ncbi:Lin1244/Lin1753 domain-containing protein [Atopobium deltae]|uniref:Lin1244/Lin1753-like N-terminal domain-containing protein n=1 Tax=Atopobium deltae TaxID=1393034 RepID=A0A133XPE3_9ACTN|nr:Lin1244/Lin1753 domain-containing protein [Atopobium deltae]KXB32807.1 hypothetical protein HMPREF3192_01487 [Atopobium deltae]
MATRIGGAFFPVDATFYDTRATRAIQRRFGDRGFRLYIKLLCMMLREPTAKLPVQLEEDWQDLASILEMDINETKEFIEILKHTRSLNVEEGQLYSPLVLQGLQDYTEAKERYSAAGRASAEARRKKAKKSTE